MTDTPEIKRLRREALLPVQFPATMEVVPRDAAIQAVRDTEAKVRHHYALSGRALREVGDAVRNSTLTDAQKVGVIAGVLANGPLDDAPGGPCEGAVFAARREAFREVVEALRDQADMLDPSDCLPPEDHYPTFRGWQGAAQFIERSFLSPDNPEGNA